MRFFDVSKREHRDGIMISKISMPEGYVEIMGKSPYGPIVSNSIISFFIKPEFRGRGLAKVLLSAAKRRYDLLTAQSSNEISVRALYSAGFRRFEAENNVLSDLVKEVNSYPHSILMIWRRRK